MEKSLTKQAAAGERRMIWIGSVFASIFWLLETAIHTYIFDRGEVNYVSQLIPQNIHELWMRSLVFFLFIAFGIYANFVITMLKKSERERETLQKQVEKALTKALSGFLTICAKCKRIKDKSGNWNQIENYIGDRTDTTFSHGICPECKKELYPDI